MFRGAAVERRWAATSTGGCPIFVRGRGREEKFLEVEEPSLDILAPCCCPSLRNSAIDVATQARCRVVLRESSANNFANWKMKKFLSQQNQNSPVVIFLLFLTASISEVMRVG